MKNQTEEVKNSDKEVVSLERGELNSLISEAVDRAMKNRGVPQKAKRVTERTATVRFHEDKLVEHYGNVYEEKDQHGKLVAYMDIKLNGEKAIFKVEYLKFLNSPNSHDVVIKKQRMEEIVESEGTFRTVNPDEARIERKNFTARVEEAEVTRRVYTSDIEVTEGPYKGQTFTGVINDDVLNK